MNCPVKDQCTRAKYGKGIQRSEYQQHINNNKERIQKNPDYYRQRQAIVEHPYGTIKRQWGFNYILTKKYKHRAEADVGLMFIAYNFRRIINLVGKDAFNKYLRVFVLYFLLIISRVRAILSHFSKTCLKHNPTPIFFDNLLNRLTFTQNLTLMAGF